jgi:hypothetical protein
MAAMRLREVSDMAQIDDELAIRKELAEMTEDQPPAPPARYAAIRRRAAVHRRRQLAGAAAGVAILVAAAIAIPLGLMRVGPPPPAGPTRHYHVSEYRPGPGSQGGLIAYGTVDGIRWKIAVNKMPTLSQGFCMNTESGQDPQTCVFDPPEPANNGGSPADFSLFSGWGRFSANLGTVASDVSYLRVSLSNGQALTLYPVAIYGRAYARFVALMVPYSSAVTSVTAYSSHGELGYAIPFTAEAGLGLDRWLRPGQPALPHPATYLIGAGTVSGAAWHEYAWIGPWGTCFGGAGGGSDCLDQAGSVLSPHQLVDSFGNSSGPGNTEYVYGQAAPSVSYLIVTTSDGGTQKVWIARAGALRYYAYASVPRNPVVRWTAYGLSGQQLGTGRANAPG